MSSQPRSPTSLLLVGTFHMAGPTPDLAEVAVGDLRTDARAREVEAVAASLARYEPTKVAVECAHDADGLDPLYQAYVRGQRALGPSEVEQLGFRVAARLGHPQVYPVDVAGRFYEETLELLLAEARHAATWTAVLEAAEGAARAVEERLAGGTVAGALRELNTATSRMETLRPYLRDLLRLTSEDNWSGAEMVANWYRRNVHIAAALVRITTPGDRVLLLYGAGHVPVLRHLLGDGGLFELVDPLEFLPER